MAYPAPVYQTATYKSSAKAAPVYKASYPAPSKAVASYSSPAKSTPVYSAPAYMDVPVKSNQAYHTSTYEAPT